MHTIELLEAALETARSLGYKVRFEWLSGSGGGDCEVKGRKLLFVDLSLPPTEQLDQTIEALGRMTGFATLPIRPDLRVLLEGRRKSA
jgi:hypothetical protein